MLGELIEVAKFFLEMFKGNLPMVQLYVIAGGLLLGVIYELIYETKHERHSFWYLLMERIFLNIAGLLFYMSFYIFGLKTLLNIWHSLLANHSIEAVSWLAISSYLSIVLLIPLGIYTVKSKNFIFQVFGVSSYFILSGVIITLAHTIFAPNIDLPILLVLLNILVNAALTFFSMKYELNKNRQKNIHKSTKAASS